MKKWILIYNNNIAKKSYKKNKFYKFMNEYFYFKIIISNIEFYFLLYICFKI